MTLFFEKTIRHYVHIINLRKINWRNLPMSTSMSLSHPEVAVPPRRGRPPNSSPRETRHYSKVVKTGCGQPE
jgi:hypothetical protein